MKHLLVWSPRLIIMAYILFLASFALDAFSEVGTFGSRMVDFLLHLTPAAVTAGFLWLAWHYRILGGLLLMVLGMIFTIYYHTDRSMSQFLLISLPLFVGGVLFIFSNWNQERRKLNDSF